MASFDATGEVWGSVDGPHVTCARCGKKQALKERIPREVLLSAPDGLICEECYEV